MCFQNTGKTGWYCSSKIPLISQEEGLDKSTRFLLCSRPLKARNQGDGECIRKGREPSPPLRGHKRLLLKMSLRTTNPSGQPVGFATFLSHTRHDSGRPGCSSCTP